MIFLPTPPGILHKEAGTCISNDSLKRRELALLPDGANQFPGESPIRWSPAPSHGAITTARKRAISRTGSFGGLRKLKFVILNLVEQAVLAETLPVGCHVERSSNDDIDWLEAVVFREKTNDGQYMLLHSVVRRSPNVHVGVAALWRHQD